MKKLLIIALLACSILLFAPSAALAVNIVHNPNGTGVCDNNTTSATCRDNAAQSTDNPLFGPHGLITDGTRILSYVVGVISVIIVVVSGLRMTLSGGDANNVATARKGLIYALVGLVVAILAQGLVSFVLVRIVP